MSPKKTIEFPALSVFFTSYFSTENKLEKLRKKKGGGGVGRKGKEKQKMREEKIKAKSKNRSGLYH